MIIEMPDLDIATRAEHPENRIADEPIEPKADEETLIARPSLCKVLSFSFLAGAVGCLLTWMTLGPALGGGDVTAALCLLPLNVVLIAVINGWIAVNVFVGSGLSK